MKNRRSFVLKSKSTLGHWKSRAYAAGHDGSSVGVCIPQALSSSCRFIHSRPPGFGTNLLFPYTPSPHDVLTVWTGPLPTTVPEGPLYGTRVSDVAPGAARPLGLGFCILWASTVVVCCRNRAGVSLVCWDLNNVKVGNDDFLQQTVHQKGTGLRAHHTMISFLNWNENKNCKTCA